MFIISIVWMCLLCLLSGSDGVVRVQTEVLRCRPRAFPQKHVPVLPELRGARTPHDRVREGGQGSHPDLSRYYSHLSLWALIRLMLGLCSDCVCVCSDPSAWWRLQSEQQWRAETSCLLWETQDPETEARPGKHLQGQFTYTHTPQNAVVCFLKQLCLCL